MRTPGFETRDNRRGREGAWRTARASVDAASLPWLALSFSLASLVLSVVAAGPDPLPGDVAVARWLQSSSSPEAGALARFADWVGSLPALVGGAVAAALVLGLARRWPAAALVLATVLLRRLNPILKEIIDSPRPTADLVRVTEHASGLGFPSGHSMGVMLLYGAVVAVAPAAIAPRWPRLLLQAGAAFVVLITGFGRVYTGAHWPSDVLGGYLWGVTVLLALVSAWRAAGFLARRPRVRRLPRR